MVIKRRRFKQTVSLKERLTAWANGIREKQTSFRLALNAMAFSRKLIRPRPHLVWRTGPTRVEASAIICDGPASSSR
jgi:hypothetical protein